jgi:hypothetical protein
MNPKWFCWAVFLMIVSAVAAAKGDSAFASFYFITSLMSGAITFHNE